MSRGLAARTIGDIFTNNQQTLMFAGIRLFPYYNNQIFFPLAENLEEQLSIYVADHSDTNITFVNFPKSKYKAAILALFQDTVTGQKIGFCKRFMNVSAKGYGKWKDIDFQKETGYFRPKGNSFQENLPIKPLNLIGNNELYDINSLQTLIINSAKNLLVENKINEEVFSHIEQMISAAINNNEAPILKNGFQYMAAYNKYFGEILAPISVITGFLSVDKDYEKDKFKNYKIQYSLSQNSKMFDSKLVDTTTNKIIEISSKSVNGADASITSILWFLKILQQENNIIYCQIFEKFREQIDILEIIDKHSSIDGPLIIARDIFELISDEEVNMVKRLIDEKISLNFFKENNMVTSNLLYFMQTYGKRNLLAVNFDQLSPSYLPGYHVLAAIAREVARRISYNNTFSEMVKALFEYRSFIQVTSSIRAINTTDCTFTQFEIHQPSHAKSIVASSSKNYFSTNIKGKIAFKLNN